ncbi:MAG: TMEM143 family protein, partial [Pseudomonadota bacterium]
TSFVIARDDEAGALPKERFIPVTRYALLDRLTVEHTWPAGQAAQARRFFRYLDFWRQQSYSARMLEIEQNYEPFSPDSDLLITRRFREDERRIMREELIEQIKVLLEQANYSQIPANQVDMILTADSAYGLDLHVDLAAFEDIMIFYRGATSKTEKKRTLKKFFLRKEEFDIPIYQRLFILFKLKPEEQRIREVMAKERVDRKKAKRMIRKAMSMLPDSVKRDYVYMKLFKNIPRTDLEMCFPNTQVRFKLLDKLKLGVTTGGAGIGAFGTAAKLITATNPVGLAIGVLGLGGVAARQVNNYMTTRQRYMVTMAQNLYFHAMADNRGVLTLMADRAVEEDVKEEMLLYAVLAKESVHRDDLPHVAAAIEHYLANSFGIDVAFDLQDALQRLVADGLIIEESETLRCLPPAEAARHIDEMWDVYLDNLPDPVRGEGEEMEADGSAIDDETSQLGSAGAASASFSAPQQAPIKQTGA